MLTLFMSQNILAENYVLKLSVSADGAYVITSNLNRKGFLWDLNKTSYSKITDNINIYTPQFNNTNNTFTWQNEKTNKFYSQELQKHPKELIKLDFPMYSYLFDGKKLLATDKLWSIYEISQNNTKTTIKKGLKNDGVFTYGFPLSLVDGKNANNFVSIGSGSEWDKLPMSEGVDAYAAGKVRYKRANFSLLNGTILWNLTKHTPIKKLVGNRGKSTGTLSPDRNILLIGDEAGFINKCNLKTNSCMLTHDANIVKSDSTSKCNGDYSLNPVTSIKFVSKKYFLKIVDGASVAILYQLASPTPIKCFKLDSNTANSLERSTSIDSSWKAHILVTGKKHNDGIIVYKFNPKKQTLKKIWVSCLKPKHSKMMQWFLDL